MKLPKDVKDKLPIFQDGLPVYEALHRFCSGYVDQFYATDNDVTSDAELRAYWKFEQTPLYCQGLPELSKSALKDQLAKGIFDVTAYHEFVGGVVEYTTDPAGAFFQVRAGRNMADTQQLIMTNSLVSATGIPMPKFIATGVAGDVDWLNHLDLTGGSVRPGWDAPEKFQAITKMRENLINELKTISELIKGRNASGEREHPFGRFDPVLFDRSVSI